MSGVNKVILVGNLGGDPELRDLPAGGQVASFSVATSDVWKDKNTGERKEKTEWHRVVVFNEQIVGIVAQYLKKGAKVYVEGALRTRKYTGNDGVDRYVTEIVIERFRGELQMLDRAEGGGRPPAATSPDDYGRVSGRSEGGKIDTGRQDGGRQSASDIVSGASPDLDDGISF